MISPKGEVRERGKYERRRGDLNLHIGSHAIPLRVVPHGDELLFGARDGLLIDL
jgi:hypothetical protein